VIAGKSLNIPLWFAASKSKCMAFLCYYAELPTCNSHRSVQTRTNAGTISYRKNKSVQTLKKQYPHACRCN
jgi:hypothetical protein